MALTQAPEMFHKGASDLADFATGGHAAAQHASQAQAVAGAKE